VKILAVLPRFPYPIDKGDKLRAYHHLRYLAARHELSVFALSDEPVQEEHLALLRSFCVNVRVFQLSKSGILFRLLRNVFGSIPFQTAYHTDKGAIKALREEIGKDKPDVLFCQLLRTGELVKDVPIPKLMDFQDTMSENVRLRIEKEPFWRRFIFRMEYRRLLAYESSLAERFESLSIISERDKNLLPEPARSKAQIVSNGIDMEYYHPQPDAEKDIDIVFVGAMSYLPNIEAARFLVKEVLPILNQRHVRVKMAIVGAEPSAEVSLLASEQVEITGRVADTRLYYARAKMLVAPMFINTGVQNKILEAAAMQIPVITTHTAADAIASAEQIGFYRAETAMEFADKIQFVLRNGAEAAELATKAADFISQTYTWEACGKKLEALLEEAKQKS